MKLGNVIELAVVVCFIKMNGFFLCKAEAADDLRILWLLAKMPVVELEGSDKIINGVLICNGGENGAVSVGDGDGLCLF